MVSRDMSAAVAPAPALVSNHQPFPGWPHFEEDDIQAVAEVLRSGRVNYWTGPHGKAFETEFAEYTGTRHAIAVANGTLALELALYALDIGPGDEVIVPSRSFVATASCVAVRGATPVFADVDLTSSNISVDTIRFRVTPATKAIIAVHLAGWPCDMGPLMAFAREHGLKVIEDCAQAHGASYDGRKIGSFGDINAFSFCQDKIMTTGGEGGMVTTDDQALYERAWSYKDHGKNRLRVSTPSTTPGYRFLHDSFGTNWRLTEPQAMLGRSLLSKLDAHVEKRRRNAAILTEIFATIPGLRVAKPSPPARHSYYKYYVYLHAEQLKAGWDLTRIQQEIQKEGVPCFAGYGEMYRERVFTSLRPMDPFPNAQQLSHTNLVFLVHPTLGSEHMHRTGRAVERVMRAATE